MLTIEGCSGRLDRVRAVLADRELDLLLLTDPCHVYYVTGCLAPWFALGAVAIGADRAVLATSAPREDGTTVDEVRIAEAQSNATIRLDQTDGIAALLAPELGRARRVGLDQGVLGAAVLQKLDATFTDVTPDLLRLRCHKDPDEVELIQSAARCIDAAYARAAQVIEPGLDELALYNELSAAVVEEAGELPLRFGQDFQCGAPGGPPRRRAARADELWILDLGVCYRGYYADASRVFAVGTPSDEQMRAHQQAVDTLTEVKRLARPGVACIDLYNLAQERMDVIVPGGMFHHLGHGIGLNPHEGPYLNPAWPDSMLEEGNTITVEPGVYSDALRGGVRVEDDMLITADGVQTLIHAPYDLRP